MCFKYLENLNVFYCSEVNFAPLIVEQLVLNIINYSWTPANFLFLTVLSKRLHRKDKQYNVSQFVRKQLLSKIDVLDFETIRRLAKFCGFMLHQESLMPEDFADIPNTARSDYFIHLCFDKLKDLTGPENVLTARYEEFAKFIETKSVSWEFGSANHEKHYQMSIMIDNIKGNIPVSSWTSTFDIDERGFVYLFFSAFIYIKAVSLTNIKEGLRLYTDDIVYLINSPDKETELIAAVFDRITGNNVLLEFVVQECLREGYISFIGLANYIVEKTKYSNLIGITRLGDTLGMLYRVFDELKEGYLVDLRRTKDKLLLSQNNKEFLEESLERIEDKLGEMNDLEVDLKVEKVIEYRKARLVKEDNDVGRLEAELIEAMANEVQRSIVSTNN